MNDEVEEIEVIKIIKKIKYKDIIWIPEPKPCVVRTPGKQNYFSKWVMDLQVDTVFCLNDFYRVHPKHEKDSKYRERLDKTILDMIKDNVIEHGQEENEFRRKR